MPFAHMAATTSLVPTLGFVTWVLLQQFPDAKGFRAAFYCSAEHRHPLNSLRIMDFPKDGVAFQSTAKRLVRGIPRLDTNLDCLGELKFDWIVVDLPMKAVMTSKGKDPASATLQTKPCILV